MSELKVIATLLKAGGPQGEGSRGGNVIGHTKSGKPIYGHHLHEGHMGFDGSDHKDAANFHADVVEATQNKITERLKEDPDFAVPQKILDFLQHHRTQMKFHQSKANTKRDITERRQREVSQVLRQNIKKSQSPFYVGLVVVNPVGEILLGKRLEDGIWTGPGGGADPMESPSQAAIREAYEEANLKLREEQLEEVVTLETEDGKYCHCFIAYITQDKETIHPNNDPDNEVKDWLWFNLNDIPKEVANDKNRITAINHARMKLLGLKKSEIAMNGEHGNPSVETSDFSIDAAASKDSEWFEKITEAMRDYSYGQEPVEIELPNNHTMNLVKVDDGLYSGFVKKVDEEGLPETVLQVEKQQIPTIIQFLRAKEVLSVTHSEQNEEIVQNEIQPIEAPQEESDAHVLEELLAVLSQFRGEGNTININFYKGHKDKLPGGLADKKKPSDFDKEQLKMGIKVELEHTDDRKLAMEIAMDHLTEDPKYYTKLKTIEEH